MGLNPSDKLCFRYFAFQRKIKEIKQEMFKFCCPRTLLKVPGCPENVYEFQTSHIDDAWKAAKEYGYDDDAAIEGRSAVDSCPECSRYQSLVDERRKIRLALGSVKGAICKRGKRIELESKGQVL